MSDNTLVPIPKADHLVEETTQIVSGFPCFVVLSKNHFGWRESLFAFPIPALLPKCYNAVPVSMIQSVRLKLQGWFFTKTIIVYWKTDNEDRFLAFYVAFFRPWINGFLQAGVQIEDLERYNPNTITGFLKEHAGAMIGIPIFLLIPFVVMQRVDLTAKGWLILGICLPVLLVLLGMFRMFRKRLYRSSTSENQNDL